MDEVIEDLVAQYAEQTSFLWEQRARAVRSAVYDLAALAELDERLDAHVEGLHVSGLAGWRECLGGLERSTSGDAFAAMVLALDTCDERRIELVLAATERVTQMVPGTAAAFGWVSPVALRTVVARLLVSPSSVRRWIGLSACVAHRVDPGAVLVSLLSDPEPLVRSRALGAVGELGLRAASSACVAALDDPEWACRRSAATSVLLLTGDEKARMVLAEGAQHHGARQSFELLLQASSVRTAHAWLKSTAAGAGSRRRLIRGSGIVGDPAYVEWLIGCMREPETARLAGEAFTLITGVELVDAQLAGERPTGFENAPNDDPSDPRVDMDPDQDLCWPDPDAIAAWWKENASAFTSGERHFMGGPVTRERCVVVLSSAHQPQRRLAANHLALLCPGTGVFDVQAPVQRQQKALSRLAGPAAAASEQPPIWTC